jgi:type IV secretion system protein VirB6
MSACEFLTEQAADGVAPALRAVDCLAGETVASAFARLFGTGSALLPALTIVLTLYIAFFGFGLLTGRSRLSVAALTPRMMTLGLVLTFATSWVAYSQVVWNLATGAPDEIASVLTGAQGSATEIFGERVDLVFGAIAEAAEAGKQADLPAQTARPGAGAAGAAASGNFTPGNLMWLGALLLLLSTVGVLVTARIALAVLMAVGPVFVVFALFDATRGLFVGWLRGMVLTAVAPLFVVLGGGIVLELLVPVVVSLHGIEGINGRAALALFVIACVHVALMVMVLRVAGTIVSGWQVFGFARGRNDGRDVALPQAPGHLSGGQPVLSALAVMPDRRSAMLLPAQGIAPVPVPAPEGAGVGTRGSRAHITWIAGSTPAGLPSLPRQRARGIGSRFAAPQATGRSGGAMR